MSEPGNAYMTKESTARGANVEPRTEASFDPERLFADSYAQSQYHFIQFVSEHLADCAKEFDGDLQEMLVLAVIGQVTLNWRISHPPDEPDGATITASRLADVTGIPRQTVRRKLLSLQKRDWVEQSGQAWRLTVRDGISPASVDLAALNQRGIERASRLLTAFHRLHSQAKQAQNT